MALKNYVTYTPEGKIGIYGRTDEVTIPEMVRTNHEWIGGVGKAETHYVDTSTTPPTLKTKLPFPGTQNKSQILADGIDEWIVTGLPVGSLVTWPDGVISTIDDGSLEFTVDLPGTYTFKIDPFPYLEEEVSVEAIT